MRRTVQGLTASAIVTAAGLLATSAAVATPAPGPTVLPIPQLPLPIPGGFTPGAEHGSDPYFPDLGNGGYTVGHYDLRLQYDPIGKVLDGTATLDAKATQKLSRFDLDLQNGLTVSTATVNGKTAGFAQTAAHKLVITPAGGLDKGASFSVSVRYQGPPQPINEPQGGLGSYGWVPTADGAVAVNQPTGADTWYPVNETNENKATYRFTITVPKYLTVLANGEPAGDTTTGAKRTFVWEMRQPMAPELAMVAIGRFNVTSTKSVGGIPNITAVQAAIDNVPDQGTVFNKTTDSLLNWESGMFGPPPFGSTGGILVTNNVGYALESQSRPVYDTDTSTLDTGAVSIIAHELAHQWFGDSLTPARWADIWLNEGFATYTEWLYSEKIGGKTAQGLFDDTYARPASDPRWQLKMADPGRNHIFDWTVYQRGAMTLHLLRKKLGDKVFFDLLKRWANDHRGSNVSSADFIGLAEQMGHQNLRQFFTAWLYTPGKPDPRL